MKTFWTALVLSSLLAACGGGGSNAGADAQGNTRLSAGGAMTSPLVPAPAASDVVTDTRSDYEKLLDAAEAKRTEAQALVTDGPCQTHDQCGALAFQEYGPCRAQSYVPYLLASSNAEAAQARTDEFNNIVRQAFAIEPVPENPVMCIMSIVVSTPQCVANKCVDTHGVIEVEQPVPVLVPAQ